MLHRGGFGTASTGQGRCESAATAAPAAAYQELQATAAYTVAASERAVPVRSNMSLAAKARQAGMQQW